MLNVLFLLFQIIAKMFLRSLASSIGSTFSNAGGLFQMSIRTNVRNRFPVAKEWKRVKVHSYEKRMSTPEGRRILLRRILKGRHVISH